jgi:hypothetical protein
MDPIQIQVGVPVDALYDPSSDRIFVADDTNGKRRILILDDQFKEIKMNNPLPVEHELICMSSSIDGKTFHYCTKAHENGSASVVYSIAFDAIGTDERPKITQRSNELIISMASSKETETPNELAFHQPKIRTQHENAVRIACGIINGKLEVVSG